MARTHDVARAVQFRVQVLLEALLVLETPVAYGAIVMHLVVVFLESRIVVEKLNFISQCIAQWKG